MSWRSSQYPDLKVYVAFTTTDPMTASPSWTEITSDVRSVRVRRGRSDETQRFSPGTATLVLDNRDWSYDPAYPSSPYNGNVLPLKQIKIEAVWNSTTYPIFRGFIEGWPQDYDESNRDATVTITANDGFEHLANFDLPDLSALLSDVGTVSFWYPLGDDNTGELYNTAVDLTYRQDGAYYYDDVTSFVDFRQGSLVGDGNSTRLSGGAHVKLSAATASVLLTPKVYTMALVFACNGNPTGEVPLIDSTGDFVDASTRVTISTAGVVTFAVQAGVASASVTGTTVVTDGKTHSVVVTRNGTALQLWVDGVSQGTATMGANSNGAGSYIQLGNYITTYASGSATYASGVTHFTGNVQHFVAYASDIGATNAAKLGGWLVGWANESTDARIGHLLDLAGWPSALRDLGSGTAIAGPARLGGTVLSEMQLVEATENGRLFIDASGNVAFLPRLHDITVTPTYTFGDRSTLADVETKAGSVRFRYDRNYMANVVTVNGASDTTALASDSASITSYGKRTKSVSTLLTNTNECRSLAEGLLVPEPVSRSDGWIVEPVRNPSVAWPIVLGVEIGQRHYLSRHPYNSGIDIVVDYHIESIEHSLSTDGTWQVKFTGSPPETIGWVLGTSDLDNDTVLSY